MDATVIVPTYKRPDDLRRCLDALTRQTLPPVRVVVVRRDIDSTTEAMLAAYDPGTLPMVMRVVALPGVVAALNDGLEAATGDIVAMTDDDAAPRPDWLERIVGHFTVNARVGGVGGRDHIFMGERRDDWPPQARVGISTWYGRTYGNHNAGFGPAREVESLKGVCMAFRRAAIGSLRFDRRLRGQGAQVANEYLFGGAIRRAGWTLIYDPAIGVDHFPAQRHDSDDRGQIDRLALRDMMHNATLGYLEYLPLPRTLAILLNHTLWGARTQPGLLAAITHSLRGRRQMWLGFREVVAGELAAIATWWRTRNDRVAERRAAPWRAMPSS
ncbi:MAG: glycosyltransferase family 2 protein [Alphaproteobacteria bacterium]|nr:glycosyltransferase family 2 protein [Alphaproteobacteria bacterium]MCW5741720.1 glycosyltransferase family 2 protein [Alphaproteobacteria bacterium]